jgi:hypothetical protein
MMHNEGLQEDDMQKLHTTTPDQLTDQELLLSTISASDLDRKHSGGWDKEYPKCLFCGKAYRFRTFTVQCHMTSQVTVSGKHKREAAVYRMESTKDIFRTKKFGKVPGSNSYVEKKFKLVTHKYEEYKGVCFGNGDCALVVDVWLNRVDEDASGLTFEEWDPSADTDASESPVAMIVNSSKMCFTGFDLREVIRESLDDTLRHLLPWDFHFFFSKKNLTPPKI